MPQTTASPIRLKADDVLFLNRQLASMARLNMPLAKGLRILARDVDDPDFRAVIEGIQQDLDEGVGLQEAMARYPETFSNLHLEIVRAGESTGNLAVILEELNSHTDAMRRIKARIVEAITYPVVISIVIFLFSLFFLLFVAPDFENMILERFASRAALNDPGDADPLRGFPATKLLFGASHLLWNPVILVAVIGLALGGAVYLFRKVSRMGDEYDDVLFRLPLFGKLFEGAALMKITRTMRDLLLNGVSMVETLRLTGRTVGRNRIQQKVDELRLAVEEGGSFSRNLAGGDVFPDTMVWKLQMAEEKGIIEEALRELASEFELQVDRQTTLITKLLSPLLMVAMGGVVFVMFVACFVPLMSVYS